MNDSTQVNIGETVGLLEFLIGACVRDFFHSMDSSEVALTENVQC